MTSEEVVKFYIKDNLIFSDNKKTLIIPSKIEVFIPENETGILEKNRFLYEELDEKSKKTIKTLDVSGEIEKELLVKLREVIKPKFCRKPKEDNYNFLEKTSQIDILNQFKEFEISEIIGDTKKEITKYLESVEDKEKKYLENIINSLNALEKDINNKNFEIDKFKRDEIVPIKKRLLELEQRKALLKKKQQEIHNQKLFEKELSTVKIEIEKLIKRDKRLNYELEKIEYDIKITSNKIDSLNERAKLGVKKVIRPGLLLLTLGVAYWTEASEIKYYKGILKSKISALKEKIIRKEREIHQNKFKLNKNTEIEKEILKKISKAEEEISEKDNLINEKVKKIESEEENLSKILDSKSEIGRKIEEETRKIVNKKKEIEDTLQTYNKYNSRKIKEKLSIIEEEANKYLLEIKNMCKKLNSQKIERKGEWIVEIPKDLLIDND